MLSGAGYQAEAGSELGRDVGPDRHRKPDELRGGRTHSGRRRRQAEDRGGVRRAAAEPGSDRNALLDRDPDRAVVPLEPFPETGERLGREIRAAHPGGDDFVRLPLGALEPDLVGERDGLEKGADLVQAVRSRATYVKAQVDLCRRKREEWRLELQLNTSGRFASSTNSSGASLSARSSGGWPICSRAARASVRSWLESREI